MRTLDFETNESDWIKTAQYWHMRWILTLILTAVCLKLFLPMRASGSGRTEYVGPKWRLDRRGIGTECKGCRRLFSSTFAFDQHRRSPAVRNTACFSLHDENRINVTAVSRANMSTAAVERRPAKRTLSRWTCWHIWHIWHTKTYLTYENFLKPGLPAAGTPGLRFHILHKKLYFLFFNVYMGGGFILVIFFCILVISKQGGFIFICIYIISEGGGVHIFSYLTYQSY